MQVKFGDIRNLEPIKSFIKSVPRGTIKVALAAISEYFIGTPKHGLRHVPAYKYVTRKKAYGQTFQSDKQRRWFWANGGPDMIGNNRTGETEKGWYMQETKSGYGMVLGNKAPGAYWTMDDEGQARQPALVGWRKVSVIIQSNMKGALRSATAAINKWLKSKGA